MIEISQKVNITDEQISDQLCNAIEGGSNYWYNFPDLSMLDESTKGEPLVDRLMVAIKDGQSIPVNDISNNTSEDLLGNLNLEGIEKGIKIMAEDYSDHFSCMVNENGDAYTGDIFLQLAVLGEIVFG